MLLESFFKGPRGLSYVFLTTCKFPTLQLVEGPTSVFHGALILRGKQDVFNSSIALEVGLYAILTADLVNAFIYTLGIRYDNVTLGFGLSGGGLSTSGVLSVGTVTSLTGKLCKPSFYPVNGPFGVLAVIECLPEVVHFLLEKPLFAAYCFGPVGKGINYTVLC